MPPLEVVSHQLQRDFECDEDAPCQFRIYATNLKPFDQFALSVDPLLCIGDVAPISG